MEVINKFFFSSLAAALVQINFFIVTFILDKFVNSELSNLIISINTAEKKDGGEGAIIIRLKNL